MRAGPITSTVVVIACVTSASALAAADLAKVRAEVESRLARHAVALANQDVDGALELYAEDAVVRPANMDPVRGKAALRGFFGAWFSAMAVKDGAYTTEEFDLWGDKAIQIGTYRGDVHVPGAPVVVDRGSFTIVWRRQGDGSWRYQRGIFNSSLPANQTVTRKQ
jgi:ketosteroid isomerase-like protein